MPRRAGRPAPTRKALLDFATACDQMAKLAREVAEEYGWAYPAAHDRTVGDEAKTRQLGPSDTTGSIVVGKDVMRTLVDRAYRQAVAGINRMDRARSLLEEALERADHHRPEPSRTRPYPKTVGPTELANLQAARDRREARGEGFGEA